MASSFHAASVDRAVNTGAAGKRIHSELVGAVRFHCGPKRCVAPTTADLKGARWTGQGRRGGERSERSLDAAKRSRMIGSGATAGTRLNVLLQGHRTELIDRVAATLNAMRLTVPRYQRTGAYSGAVVESPRSRLSRALRDGIAVTSAQSTAPASRGVSDPRDGGGATEAPRIGGRSRPGTLV